MSIRTVPNPKNGQEFIRRMYVDALKCNAMFRSTDLGDNLFLIEMFNPNSTRWVNGGTEHILAPFCEVKK